MSKRSTNKTTKVFVLICGNLKWLKNYVRLFTKIGMIRAISFADHQHCGRVINIPVLYSGSSRFQSLPGDMLPWHAINGLHQSLLLWCWDSTLQPAATISFRLLSYLSYTDHPKYFGDPAWFAVGVLKPTKLGLQRNNDKYMSPNGIRTKDSRVPTAKDHERLKSSDMIPPL
jgi:hypothetical protein